MIDGDRQQDPVVFHRKHPLHRDLLQVHQNQDIDAHVKIVGYSFQNIEGWLADSFFVLRKPNSGDD